MSIFEKQAFLIDYEIVTEKEFMLVTNICGYNDETLDAILYERTGYHDFSEYEKEMCD